MVKRNTQKKRLLQQQPLLVLQVRKWHPLFKDLFKFYVFPNEGPREFNCNLTNQNIQAPGVYWQNHVNRHAKEIAIYLQYRDLDIKL